VFLSRVERAFSCGLAGKGDANPLSASGVSNLAAGPRQPYIGGQAVIEGVMMRSPKSFVVAVRRYDGRIAIREQAWHVLWPKLTFLRWPIFRGAVVLAESLHNGFSALKFSSEHGLPPDQQGQSGPPVAAFLATLYGALVGAGDGPPSGQEPKATAANGTRSDAMLVLATLLMVVFFIGLPHALTWLVGLSLGDGFDTQSFAFHFIDGVFRVLILVGYVWVLSKTKDAARLFEYHGAEHKAIWAYESFKPLVVAEAKPFTTRHPRCGTSFLFIVVGVAVLLHVALLPLVPKLHDNAVINQLLMVLIKVPMAFPIAGLAYELQRLSAKDRCPAFIKGLTRPGIWLQSITTKEPTDAQLEIALLSLDRALAREEGRPRAPEGVTLYETFEKALP
jgi:uncharacterized protein YqhQ